MIYYTLIFVLLTFASGIDCLNETCSRNSDCSNKGAVCVSGRCNCDTISYYNNNLTQCLPYATEYGAVCTETIQCGWLGDNVLCLNNRCVCRSLSRWYKGECRPYVDKGGSCKVDDDCYNGYDLLSMTCSSGVCACSKDYYDRGYDCRKMSVWKRDDDCALNIDCKSDTVSLECALGKCVETNSSSKMVHPSVEFEGIEEEKIIAYAEPDETLQCANDDDCRDIANSLCNVENGTCACNSDTHYYYGGSCVLGLKECTSTEDCGINNAVCFKNTTCVCDRGFFARDKQCVAELGVRDPNVAYTKDGDCPIKPGKLVNSVCYCKNYWFNDEANRNCIKTMIQSTQSCLTNEWCYAMGADTFCNSTSGKCACSKFAKLNEATYHCDPEAQFEEDSCLKDNQCGVNERCVDERCVCLENFSRNAYNVCLPDIGGSCSIWGCSHIKNGTCAGGLCACGSNYIGKVDRCLKIADNLLDTCEAEEQCQNIEHSVCGVSEDDLFDDENATRKCVCEEDYTAVSNRCYQSRKYGDPCLTESDCTLVLNQSYQCRNSLCQCAVGEKLKNGYCTSSGVAINVNTVVLLLVVLILGLS